MSAAEICAAKHAIEAIAMIKHLKCDEKTRQGMIYSMICQLKTEMPADFEEALVCFLKHGTGEELDA